LGSKYDPQPRRFGGLDLKYLVGLDKYALDNSGDEPGYYQLNIGHSIIFDHNSSHDAEADGIFGNGIYALELWYYEDLEWKIINETPIILDYSDLNYPNTSSNLCVDLIIIAYKFQPWPGQDGLITYKWAGGLFPGNEISTIDENLPAEDKNKIKVHKQYKSYNPGTSTWTVDQVTPNVGVTGYTKSEYLLFPINGEEIESGYQIPNHPNPGLLVSPLEIQANHHPKVKCGETVTNQSKLVLYRSTTQSSSLTVGDVASTNCGAVFVNDPAGTIHLLQNTQFIVEAGSRLYLEKNSRVSSHSLGVMRLKSGSFFCNKGAIFYNDGVLKIDKYVQFCIPDPQTNITSYFQDSAKLILDSGAVFEIPDSTTYIFEGTETALICHDSSVVKFGKQSKLVFRSGARINANNCTFKSNDAANVWDGIYLEDYAFDTLKNCTFENAYNGLNITDNYNPFGSPYAVEISNCTFKNSSSTDLLNMVYVNNSSNVLIKGINTVKTGSAGFTAGIIAEYCPTNGVIITDNILNYITTGISLLQSSVYIARNSITGSTNSGTGIYLDNSNGTIEYNTVNNFQKSVYGSYSSPYILKNTLSNAYIKNTELVSNSFPVMKPVVSGSTLRWLGGNNIITGSPSHSGIGFVDCYPLMDSGYNKIIVNGSDYLNGIFTMAYTTVNARINYWYDDPPVSNLFDMTGGDVNYDDPFDGSSLPSTDGSELNSLGWGMYDTVFTLSLGDNSTAEDLFMQAYTEEMSQNYTDAITHYKDVVSSYKTSSYAPVSLSRIFNCLEKSGANSSAYQSIQSYYSGIKTNQSHPYESRELAEDFEIKSKVKQGNIEEAVSDYNTIYLANTSNSKGMHALVNKLCLENMIQGDNSSSGLNSGTNHKINLLSLISGEDIRTRSLISNTTPAYFKLHQNYPNPFNPGTTIKFDIPTSGQAQNFDVRIKIYDMLGREVFQYSDVKSPGSYEIRFDGTNLASGMYIYVLNAGSFTDTKKMVLLK
jgi:parallel beta-helix repeat protein